MASGFGCGLAPDQAKASALPNPAHYLPGDPSDPNQIRLAVRFVSFLDVAGKPTASADEADRFLKRANEIYSACSILFRLEEYLSVLPQERGLAYGLSNMAQLDPTRLQFDVASRLVIIDTGNWDHSTMGTANAWTAMPGSSPSGAVVEAAINTYPEIIAHELGHYLNLDHTNDARNLMNPVIYHSSIGLAPAQCLAMRETAVSSRTASLR